MSSYKGKVVASKSARSKVFHYPSCKFVSTILKDNLITFKNKDEARKKGYRHCVYCSRIIKYYEENKKEIDSFIKSNGLKMYIDDDSMYIDNIFYSWKITISPTGYNVILYHANTETYNSLKVKNGHFQHNYHLQKYKDAPDIMHILQYIVNHDNWKISSLDNYKKMPKRTKRQKKEYYKARRKSNRIKIRNLHNFLDKLSLERDKK